MIAALLTATLLFAQDADAEQVDRLIRELSQRKRSRRDAARETLTRNAHRWWEIYAEKAAEQKNKSVKELLGRLVKEGQKRDPKEVLEAVTEILEDRGWERSVPLPGFFEQHLRVELAEYELEFTPGTLSRALLMAYETLKKEEPTPALLGSLANSLGGNATPETRGPNRTALLEILEQPHPIVRSSAIDALAAMGATEEGERIAGHAADGALIVRLRAVRAIATLGLVNQIPRLESLLKDEDWQIREAALNALFSIDPDVARGHLAAVLADGAREVRMVGILLAQRSREERNHATAASLLSDPDAGVRAEAARYFGKLRDPEYAERVAALLEDDTPRVRRNALFALATMGAEEFGPEIVDRLRDRSPEVLEAALKATAALDLREGADAAARLFRNRSVRYAAYQTVGLLRAKKHTPTLVKAAQTRNNDDVSTRALIALSRMQDPDSAEDIVALIEPKQANRTVQAIITLARMRHTASAEKILAAARKVRARNMEIALDAYHILALDARDTARVSAALRNPKAGRSWYAQAFVHELRDGLAYQEGMARLFDPDCETLRELVEQIREQLGLEVDVQLGKAMLDRPLRIPTPLSLGEALTETAAVFGYRLGADLRDGKLVLMSHEASARALEAWLSKRG